MRFIPYLRHACHWCVSLAEQDKASQQPSDSSLVTCGPEDRPREAEVCVSHGHPFHSAVVSGGWSACLLMLSPVGCVERELGFDHIGLAAPPSLLARCLASQAVSSLSVSAPLCSGISSAELQGSVCSWGLCVLTTHQGMADPGERGPPCRCWGWGLTSSLAGGSLVWSLTWHVWSC